MGDDGIIRQRDLKFPVVSSPGASQPTTRQSSGNLQGSLIPASAFANQDVSLEDVLHRLIDQATPDLFEHVETLLVNTAYEFCERNQVRTARLLGISRNILRSHLMRLDILPKRQPTHGRNDADASTPVDSTFAC